ncbi:hypothetical protein [Candidatus Albibeggiatoa sp. nov. NOAA]|uniref:hypothetical protein n=1 Tax=Candidatus Albibeggiatoa sp. nov. NOAA TaxID=3162724 RepID=UPI0033014FF0|nr:hypothetical protein [Thiotrichaceae bacterium]
MLVDIDTLEKASAEIFKYLREVEVEAVEFEDDYYWHIVEGQRYDPFQKPDDMTMGQLSFDWDDIKKIANKENEPIGYALVWLAALYTHFGENCGA